MFCFLLKIHPRRQCILGGGVCVVVVADVNAERNADGQQNGQQPEKNSAGKRFFLLVLHCLEHKIYNINQVNTLLFEYDQEQLGA